ncbi:hypothetical protein NLU13_7854 [Sarocladium strictum]|uniref:HpcH/HpaI aldolase/citrate lyase domain-containing protein n=1 Tax=Sarocladium strictum TaxID=5046 RepID=A0AA39GER8_SARSR|nr:hypothetical protein NLU13_7854 [Sarocladium strictum]
MSTQISSPVVNASGKTKLRESLERAKAGHGPSIGQWLMFPGYTLAKAVAGLGMDWILVDCEHGNIDDSAMYHSVGAIASSGVSPMVRIPASEPWMFKRALDAGAHAIMVPMCETKEQAEGIVKAAKYPSKEFPGAFRGAGALFAPANFNQTGREYLFTANRNIMVCVQIETRLAIENVEAIANVPGIDMLFIGPNDLAASMGYVASDHGSIPEVQEAGKKVLEAAKEAGKYAGYFAMSAGAAAQKYREGWEFMNCGADVVALTSWMSNEMETMKSMIQSSEGKTKESKDAGAARGGYS